MIPPAFDYLTPQSLSEVIGLLHQHGPDAKVLAGGHNLIPAMRLRFAEPCHLIEISGLEDLNCIREADGLLRIASNRIFVFQKTLTFTVFRVRSRAKFKSYDILSNI